MTEKATKWAVRVVIGVIVAAVVYSIYLLYWKMYFVGK